MKNGALVDINKNTLIVKTPNGCIEVVDYTSDDNLSIRPGDGVSPKCLKNILGNKEKRCISHGNPFVIKYINEIIESNNSI